MATFSFDRSDKSFIAKDDKGNEVCFEYHPSLPAKLWTNIQDFTLYSFRHPVNNGGAQFANISLAETGETVGMLIPFSTLVSEIDEDDRILGYIFIAYQLLLSRILVLDSENFESYYRKDLVVLVLNNQYLPKQFEFGRYALSLYQHGYFMSTPDDVRVQQGAELGQSCLVEGYNYSFTKNLVLTKSNFSFKNTNIEPFIKQLVFRELSKTTNVVHRFIILYQVIELLMDKMSRDTIVTLVDQYKAKQINKNDLSHSIKDAVEEKSMIHRICDAYSPPANLREDFRYAVDALFKKANCGLSTAQYQDSMYDLRNQLFHSYRNYAEHKTELAMAVQCFEKIILFLLANYQWEESVKTIETKQ